MANYLVAILSKMVYYTFFFMSCKFLSIWLMKKEDGQHWRKKSTHPSIFQVLPIFLSKFLEVPTKSTPRIIPLLLINNEKHTLPTSSEPVFFQHSSSSLLRSRSCSCVCKTFAGTYTWMKSCRCAYGYSLRYKCVCAILAIKAFKRINKVKILI